MEELTQDQERGRAIFGFSYNLVNEAQLTGGIHPFWLVQVDIDFLECSRARYNMSRMQQWASDQTLNLTVKKREQNTTLSYANAHHVFATFGDIYHKRLTPRPLPPKREMNHRDVRFEVLYIT